MSVTRAMWAGVSGLGAEGQALGVIGDNVANANTIGFKASRALFEDVLGGAAGQNVGAGVRMARAQQIFGQGSIQNTGQPTDLAISGEGFFVVEGTLGGIEGQYFTRAGQTSLNADGFLVTPNGMRLQGYPMNPDGTVGGTLGDVQLSQSQLAPKPTSALNVDANLDAGATPPAAPWDPADPSGTSNFSTPTTMYDSLGQPHDVTIYFVNTGPGQWEYHAMTDGADVAGGTPGTPVELGTGTLTYDGNGALDTANVPALSVDWAGATPGQSITLDFGTPIAAGGTGLDGITQYGSPSSIGQQSQDGYASGSLAGVRVDADGTVNGVYTNGEVIAVAQLGIAKFTSNDGLGRAGQNVWMATKQSGEAAISAAGSGGRGSIVAGALEQSNVDITQQFVELIVHQRSFQANSKTITTADEMLQEVVNLKR